MSFCEFFEDAHNDGKENIFWHLSLSFGISFISSARDNNLYWVATLWNGWTGQFAKGSNLTWRLFWVNLHQDKGKDKSTKILLTGQFGRIAIFKLKLCLCLCLCQETECEVLWNLKLCHWHCLLLYISDTAFKVQLRDSDLHLPKLSLCVFVSIEG